MNSVIGKNNLSAFMDKPTPEPTPSVEPKNEPTPEQPIETKNPEPTPTPAPTPENPEPVPNRADTAETKPQEEVKPVETPTVDEDAFKAFVKEKYGKEVDNFETLFKEPEPTVDPLEGLSEEAKQFLKYNKETGRGYNDYQTLNRDIESLSPLDIAREKAINLSNGALSSNDVDAYLEKKLNIDLSDPKNLEKFDQIELSSFGGDYKNQLLENKEKYAAPIEKQVADEDLVTLDNGVQMRKADYDAAVAQRNQYLADVQKASDKITASTYDVKIDDNGTEKVLPLSYEYSKQEVLDMASNASDIDNTITRLFSDGKGGVDHAKLQEGLFRADPKNFGKLVSAYVHKALAQQAEEFMAKEHNVKVPTKQMPGQKGPKRVAIPGQAPTSNSGYLQYFNKP